MSNLASMQGIRNKDMIFYRNQDRDENFLIIQLATSSLYYKLRKGQNCRDACSEAEAWVRLPTYLLFETGCAVIWRLVHLVRPYERVIVFGVCNENKWSGSLLWLSTLGKIRSHVDKIR